jgi:tetratricopeptide (TPR) repeat protein
MHQPRRTLVAAIAIVVAALVSTGCKKFNSRRLINEGNKLYKAGKFEEAAKTYEAALKEEDIDACHYNLGITYVKLFIPGSTSDKNKEYADRAAEELAKWLEKHPKDNDVRNMMTNVWIDSEQFEKALAFWQKEYDADPKNRDVISQLAGINLKADRFDEMVRWVMLDVELAPNNEGKIKSLVGIGNAVFQALRDKEKNTGQRRIHIADTGISALQKVVQLDPDNEPSQGLLTAIYNFRALAQGASWAASIDRASSQNHDAKHRVQLEELKKKKKLEEQQQQQQQQQQPAPGQPAPPAGKAGG